MDLMDYRRKIIANSPHLASASGAVATFSDGADLPLKSLIVDIEPVQSGTGDPSPSNVRPISGWTGCEVNATGKNLLALPFVYYTGVSTDLSNYFFIKAGTYVFSFSASTASSWRFIVRLKDLDGNVISDSQHNPSNTLAYRGTLNGYTNGNNTTAKELVLNIAEDCYIRILHWMTANPQTDTFNDCKLEEGSTATPYEPYNGVNVSIDLGQTVYGGTLNVLTGVLTVDGLGVPMESLTWYRSTSYANPLFYATVTGKASDYRKACCSMFRNIGSATIIAAQGFANQSADGDFASSNGNAQIFVRLDSATTVQAFVTAVTGQTIVYPLANPTTIQLTPHQIRSLYGSNTIFADTGNVALEYWAHP